MGKHAAKRSNAPVLILVALFVLALVFVGTKLFGSRDNSQNQAKNGGGVSASASGSGTSSASNCGDYQIAAPAEVAAIVTETVGAKLGCHNVKVTTASSLAFLEQSSAGTVHPDAWITEAAVWLSVYNERRADNTDLAAASVGRVVASTPVVLAVPASLANADTTGPHNWIDALANLQLSAAAPGEYAPAALAFTAVWQMFANLPGGEQAVSEPFFEIVRAQVPIAASFERAATTSTARAFPTTEQQIRAWNTAHTAARISAMTPNEGAPMMNYTLVRFDQGTKDADAFSALETALTSDAATKAFTAAGFRAADGTVAAELVPGVPVVLPGTAPQIGTKTLVRLLSDMQWITRKVSILNVVDVSGSMVEKSADQTRIERAIDAVNETTSRLPDNARAGLWVFSSDRRPGGRDYEELLKVATLGSAKDSGSQRVALTQAVNSIGTLVRGDTGLYDTIAAAFESARKNYIDNTQNLVVVVTDGRNDDPTGGLDEAGLIARLTSLQDDKQPIRLVLIGMGPDSDAAALARITKQVHGITASVRNPEDLLTAFASAVWTVGTTGNYDVKTD